MIRRFIGDVYIKSDVDIVFNPVGVRDNKKGFIRRIRKMYPKAYAEYKEKVHMYSRSELMGDIQLVKLKHNRFLLNAFCKEVDGSINSLALCKTLVELCNLSYEYHIVAGIEDRLGIGNEAKGKLIDTVIEQVFGDVESELYVYKREKHY